MMRWAPLAAFAVFAIVLFVGLFREGRDVLPSTYLDNPAPDFELPLYEGEGTLTLADITGGEPVVLNFWASWCGPCIAEHPELTRLSKMEGVRVFGINYKNEPEDAAKFLKRHGNPFTAIGVDAKGRAGIEYGVAALPESFVISGDGTVVYKHVGPINPGDLEGKILPALEEARKR